MQIGWDNWILDVPNDWTVVRHPECLTLEPLVRGALQFSYSTRRSGHVDYGELQRVAGRLNDGWGVAEGVAYKNFSGILFSYMDEDDVVWRRWFLMHESTLLFVTYNADDTIPATDEGLIQNVLNSLRVLGDVSKPSIIHQSLAALRARWK